MEVEITQDRENKLLERREVKFKASFQGPTPKREDVRGKLIALLDSDRELTVLDSMASDYGSKAVKGYVKVYASKKAMEVEPKYILKRNFAPKEEKPKEEGKETPAKEAGKEAAPKEDAKPKEKEATKPKEEK
ncbi:MAG: 30S ribosomal protein S24e [Candidatus Altiarchaeota archaeon]